MYTSTANMFNILDIFCSNSDDFVFLCVQYMTKPDFYAVCSKDKRMCFGLLFCPNRKTRAVHAKLKLVINVHLGAQQYENRIVTT